MLLTHLEADVRFSITRSFLVRMHTGGAGLVSVLAPVVGEWDVEGEAEVDVEGHCCCR